MNTLTFREHLIAASLTGLLANSKTQEAVTTLASLADDHSLAPKLNALGAITAADAVLAEIDKADKADKNTNS